MKKISLLIIFITGCITGMSHQLKFLKFVFPSSLNDPVFLNNTQLIPRLMLGSAAMFIILLIFYTAILYPLIKYRVQNRDEKDIIKRITLVFSILNLFILVILFNLPGYLFALITFAVIIFFIFYLKNVIISIFKKIYGFEDSRSSVVFLTFFLSGFAAIIYQLMWQRALFTIIGSNIESVTIVVTAFMLGLGIGSLAGGRVSLKFKNHLILIFAVVELAIGCFGFFSLSLFKAVGGLILNFNYIQTSIMSLLLILIPTVLMGSTLPLLVEHFSKQIKNVGKTVGSLYFINTLGSAFGAIFGAVTIFRYLYMSGSIYLAVSINFFIALVILIIFKFNKKPGVK